MIFGRSVTQVFLQEICFSGGKQTIHKVSAAFIVKNCHPGTPLKQNVFKEQSYVNISYLLKQHSYKVILKSILIERCYSMFTFCIRNHEPFGSLTKNRPKLNKTKSKVSRFSVVVVYKSTVSTVQKSNYVRCFNFCQCLYLHIYFLIFQ